MSPLARPAVAIQATAASLPGSITATSVSTACSITRAAPILPTTCASLTSAASLSLRLASAVSAWRLLNVALHVNSHVLLPTLHRQLP